MKSDEFTALLNASFGGLGVFSSKDLSCLIEQHFPAISENTIAWKINQLKQDGFIFQVGRGLYSLDFLPEYEPSLSLRTKRFINKIDKDKYPNLTVWDTSVFEHIFHQAFDKSWIFILLPKQNLESLFSDLQSFSKPVFLNPDKATITRYLLPQTDAVILLPSVSQMPVLTQNSLSIPSIEAILVNIWFDYERYFPTFSIDLKSLFELSFNKYTINRSKMLRYAARRDKRDAIEAFINNLTTHD